MEKKRYVMPYNKLPIGLKKHVDDIQWERKRRLGLPILSTVSSAASMAALALADPALKKETAAVLALLGLGAASAAVKADRGVVKKTYGLAEEMIKKRSSYFSQELIRGIQKGKYTHAHVDRKGNLVFTKEKPEFEERVVMPKILKPETWRWRLKVPVYMSLFEEGRWKQVRLHLKQAG